MIGQKQNRPIVWNIFPAPAAIAIHGNKPDQTQKVQQMPPQDAIQRFTGLAFAKVFKKIHSWFRWNLFASVAAGCFDWLYVTYRLSIRILTVFISPGI